MPRRGYQAIARTATLVAVLHLVASCAMHETSPREKATQNLKAMRIAAAAMPDAPRAAKVARAIDGLERELVSLRDLIEAFRRDVGALNAKPDATRAELEGVMDAFDTQRKNIRMRVLGWHAEMIAATTPAEWKSLAPLERAALLATEH